MGWIRRGAQHSLGYLMLLACDGEPEDSEVKLNGGPAAQIDASTPGGEPPAAPEGRSPTVAPATTMMPSWPTTDTADTADAGNSQVPAQPDPVDASNPGDAVVDATPALDTMHGPLEAEQIGEPALVADGFQLAESPVWDPCQERLLFADVSGNAGQGVIHALAADGRVEVLEDNSSNANGMAMDFDGRLLLAQMGNGGHLARRNHDGTIEVLEPPGSPNLHTPDDVVLRSDGTIYFTDGDFAPIGRLLGYNDPLPVYMLPPDGDSLMHVATVRGPNGIELSPDEGYLYVNAYGDGTVLRFPVAQDGSLGESETVVRWLDNADSLCLDAAGNLYVGVRAGLRVSDADGNRVTVIPIPGGTSTTGTTNCTFGGPDGTTLYITSYTSLYKVEDMPIPGLDWTLHQQRVQCP